MNEIDLTSVNPLKKRKDYDKARAAAVTSLLDKTTKPTRGNVAGASPDRHSVKFRRNVVIGLAFICIVAGGLSAIHQFISSDSVLSPFFSGFLAVPLRVLSILACWLLGETGCLLFSVAAGVVARTRFETVIFRVVSLSCAGIALVGNVSSAQLHAGDIPTAYFVLSWMLTTIPPSIFIACGYVLERLFLNDRERSFANEAAYQVAIEKYNLWRDNIDKTPAFRRVLGNEIIMSLRNISAYNNDAIDALDADYGDGAMFELQIREIKRWDRGLLTDGADAVEPPLLVTETPAPEAPGMLASYAQHNP